MIRFDAAGTELNMPPGSSFEVQGQKLILPSGPEGSLTMDQRAMVRLSWPTCRIEADDAAQTLATAVSSGCFHLR